MKFMKVTHFVARSFGRKPSFVIDMLMDDGTTMSFVSNGCQFVPNTTEDLGDLMWKFKCERQLDKLLASPIESHDEITKTDDMFNGSYTHVESLTEFHGQFKNATCAAGMFAECDELEKLELSMPMVKANLYMFDDCFELIDIEKVSQEDLEEGFLNSKYISIGYD
ncbi:hypothetical protein NVP1081O_228 [Vibrio phage 1.081.O._10N.286.52.C2]|nr:hypothetical protein NVP1081O_228 [Vibrio phage 1.081.O._10N.286.52.C2]